MQDFLTCHWVGVSPAGGGKGAWAERGVLVCSQKLMNRLWLMSGDIIKMYLYIYVYIFKLRLADRGGERIDGKAWRGQWGGGCRGCRGAAKVLAAERTRHVRMSGRKAARNEWEIWMIKDDEHANATANENENFLIISSKNATEKLPKLFTTYEKVQKKKPWLNVI